MIDKAFIEITDICNLDCSFCAGHCRKKEHMPLERFKYILDKLDGKVRYLYLHLMGEPLLHPEFPSFLKFTEDHDFRVMLTTNGTLLNEREDVLLDCKSLYKISISLHSFEGNDMSRVGMTLDTYIDRAVSFAKKSAEHGIITVFRLWNKGAQNSFNDDIVSRLHALSNSLGRESESIRSGERLGDKLFLEWGERFEWPTRTAGKNGTHCERFCRALRDQFGVLVDGTVVPCCLDHDGALALGNIFEQELEELLGSPRARAIYDGFTRHTAIEDYCKTCKQNPGSI